jgi:PASTA domain-containing protein
MIRFSAVLLRGAIATFAGLLIAGGTLTLAADRAPTERPTLVPVPPGPATLDVPDVTGQAYVFAKGILQDQGFAWHVRGPVQGYAANTVATQSPSAGTTVLDSGAPIVTVTLTRNPSYVERGTPENDAPYPGTVVSMPAGVPEKPTRAVARRLEHVQVRAAAVRKPDFVVPGAPKEPRQSPSLPAHVSALATWIEGHRRPSATNLNHWLYEHAYVVAGARFGWRQGAAALRALVQVDRRAEVLWGVGTRSRLTAEKALAEVRARSG